MLLSWDDHLSQLKPVVLVETVRALSDPSPFLAPWTILIQACSWKHLRALIFLPWFLPFDLTDQQQPTNYSGCISKNLRPGGASGKEPAYQWRNHRRHVFDPWLGKIPRRRAWQPTPVFLPGEFSWTEKPGGLQSMGPQKVRPNWSDLAYMQTWEAVEIR